MLSLRGKEKVYFLVQPFLSLYIIYRTKLVIGSSVDPVINEGKTLDPIQSECIPISPSCLSAMMKVHFSLLTSTEFQGDPQRCLFHQIKEQNLLRL